MIKETGIQIWPTPPEESRGVEVVVFEDATGMTPILKDFGDLILFLRFAKRVVCRMEEFWGWF